MPEPRFHPGDVVECVSPIDDLVAGQLYEVWRSRMEPLGEFLWVTYRGLKRQPMGQDFGWFAFRFRLVRKARQ